MKRMKLGISTIRHRFRGGLRTLGNRLSRVRHFRGHGVHSPFVYDLVRHVFMRGERLLPGDRTLYDSLLSLGVGSRRSAELQNLALHCGYTTFGIDRVGASLCLLTPGLSRRATVTMVRAASSSGHTVVVLSPYSSRERQALCNSLVSAHGSTSVDNRGYLLLFNNHLPKQHFRI